MQNEETVSSRDSTSFAFQESIVPDFFCDGLKSFIKSQWPNRYLYSRVYSCKGPNWESRTELHTCSVPTCSAPWPVLQARLHRGKRVFCGTLTLKKGPKLVFFFFWVHSLLLDPNQRALSSTQLEVIRALWWSAHTQGGWAGEAAMRQKKRRRGRREELWEKKTIIRSASMSLKGNPKGHGWGYESQCKCFSATTDSRNHMKISLQEQNTGYKKQTQQKKYSANIIFKMCFISCRCYKYEDSNRLEMLILCCQFALVLI